MLRVLEAVPCLFSLRWIPGTWPRAQDPGSSLGPGCGTVMSMDGGAQILSLLGKTGLPTKFYPCLCQAVDLAEVSRH